MNRLANEPSPYLRQHAENPVDWYPWGPEALERARAEDKPILLSIGYSACHWCHVMAHESFENPALAAVMNAHFINVKVDREERPDVDQLYQGVVQLMGKGGGWPLTIFLTPKLEPFYGGTYFPPAARHGLPAFGSLLEGIGEAWVKERAELEHQASVFKEGLTEYASYGLAAKASAWTKDDVVSTATKLSSVVDRTHGGFGTGGPKFPNPMNVAFLLRGWRRTGDEAMKQGALLTLEKMALGGVHDQLGGGFHRYSVDERWLVPHFEKMLYDTAQLIHLYAEAQQVEPRPLWRETVERAVAWVEREMTAPGGGFYSAQDADSDGEEGLFFVWTPEEIDALLSPEDAALVKRVYGVTKEGNFEHGATVLEVKEAVADPRFERARQVLFEARKKRVAPGLDDKILAGWNGLMIRGLAFASRVFDRPEWAQRAKGAADFVLTNMRREDGALERSHGRRGLDGVLEDYGDLAAGLLALAQATHEAKYVKAALELVDEATDRFWDEEKKAWLASASVLLVPTYALHDNAFPSGASTITEAQLVLGAMTGQANYLDHAAAYLERMREELLRNPLGFGHLLLCADTMLDGAAEVSLVGSVDETRAWRKVIDATYLPTVSVLRQLRGEPVPEVMKEVLESREQAGAYVCQHFACQRPVRSEGELRRVLKPLCPSGVEDRTGLSSRPAPANSRSPAPSPPPPRASPAIPAAPSGSAPRRP